MPSVQPERFPKFHGHLKSVNKLTLTSHFPFIFNCTGKQLISLHSSYSLCFNLKHNNFPFPFALNANNISTKYVTSMYSSRMCTAHLLTISRHLLHQWGVSQLALGRGVCIPACSGGVCWGCVCVCLGGVVCPGGVCHTPLGTRGRHPPCEQND